MKWTLYQYFFRIHCFRLYRRGCPHFLVYSKECKIINVPTQVRLAHRNYVKHFHKNLTGLNSVQCTVHDVTIKITSNQSSWRTYLQFLHSKNVKTFFLYLLRLSIIHWNSVIIFCQMIDIYFLYIKYFMSLHYICSKSSQYPH
jgi:hypothetical protein